MSSPSTQSDSPWPHRWAVVLVCATFPLAWVGGLVTTTDAGMAVPDWPSTYGINLFLYPWQTWLAAPWDLFIEHGHRLLGALVGMITLILAALLWRLDSRQWMRGLAVVAVVLVIVQGILGGMRVLLDERMLAMAHGCTAPLFFGLAVAIVVLTSKTWRAQNEGSPHAQAGLLQRLALLTSVLCYLQLVLGAMLRHVPVGAEPTLFAMVVKFHLLLAAALLVHGLLLAWQVGRHFWLVKPIRRLTLLFVTLLLLQLVLGAGVWGLKYSVAQWAEGIGWLGAYTIRANGWLQTHVVTAHTAMGSLLLGTSLALTLYTFRLFKVKSVAPNSL